MPVLVFGCTGHIVPESNGHLVSNNQAFVIITAKSGDTPTSLAETYLGDSVRAWQILSFNQMESLKPGRRVVIPLQPVSPGGLTTLGYQTVPVLAYADTESGGDRISKAQLSKSQVSNFEAQMRFLERNGFTAASMEQFHNFLQFRDSLPPKSVVLAFHTENRWFYQQVWPVLNAYGFTAILFISPASIGKPETMGWQEISDLSDAGVDIGIRTIALKKQMGKNEAPVQRLQEIENTLKEARDHILKHLKRPCPYFSYPPQETDNPDNEIDDLTIAMLKQFGYRLAFTPETGSNPFFSDTFKLKQRRIDFGMTEAEFKPYTVVFQRTDME